MKRISMRMICIAGVCLISWILPPADAHPQDVVPIIDIGIAHGVRNEYVDIPVTLVQATEIDEFTLGIYYNKVFLEFTRYKLEGTLLQHFETFTIKDELGFLTIEASAGAAPPIHSPGVLFYLRFLASPIADWEAEIWSWYQAGDLEKAEISDGYVYFGAVPPTPTPRATPTFTPTPTLPDATPTPVSTSTPIFTPTSLPNPTPTPDAGLPEAVYKNPVPLPELLLNDLTRINGTFAGLIDCQSDITDAPPPGRSEFGADGYALRFQVSPGQGTLFIFAKQTPIPVDALVLVRALVWSSHPSARIFVGAIDSDAGNNLQQDLGLESLFHSQTVTSQWGYVTALHRSQSGWVRPLLQVVGGDQNSVVFVDNIEVYELRKDRFYSGALLGASE